MPHARSRMSFRTLCLAAALLAARGGFASAADPAFQVLGGRQIRAALSGKYVTDEHHWGHRYLTDGRLTRMENGRRRPGRWSVQEDQLCLLLPEISEAEPICYQVQRDADELRYVDGKRVAYQGFIRSSPRMFKGIADF